VIVTLDTPPTVFVLAGCDRVFVFLVVKVKVWVKALQVALPPATVT